MCYIKQTDNEFYRWFKYYYESGFYEVPPL
jgi:hypothetical protein